MQFNEGDLIDFGDYPENTDFVIAALHSNEDGSRLINGIKITGLSLKEISDETSLTKSQVRTRVKKLVANEHIEEQVPYPSQRRATKYYRMKNSAKRTAIEFNLDDELLAEISKEPSHQDMIDVLFEISKNEAKIVDIRGELSGLEHFTDD